MISSHLNQSTKLPCLSKCAEVLQTHDGHSIELWELSVEPYLEDYLSDWARCFRQHYCADEEIDDLRQGTGLSRTEYLTQLVFPDQSEPPGPSIRAGDFAELLVSDYVEHLLGYWVPRGKYADKASRNESVKGVDILGFHCVNPLNQNYPEDRLLAFEVKAQLSDKPHSDALQNAINHSSKDYVRRAETLNATKRRLIQAKSDKVSLVERFQNLADRPYIYKSGAAAVLSDAAYDAASLQEKTKASEHQNAANLQIIVIHGKELMKLVHALYERAANEA